jgi:hypothetical protein
LGFDYLLIFPLSGIFLSSEYSLGYASFHYWESGSFIEMANCKILFTKTAKIVKTILQIPFRGYCLNIINCHIAVVAFFRRSIVSTYR